MNTKLGDFLDLYPDFHKLPSTEQITRLVYFHTVSEQHGTVDAGQLKKLFELAELRPPKNSTKLLAYLCGRGQKLIHNAGRFTLQRHVRAEIESEIEKMRGRTQSAKIDEESAFDFQGQKFADKKVVVLLDEAKRCYSHACWNACGILVRIVVERVLDAADPAVRAKTGLKDKLNLSSNSLRFSKSVREGIRELFGAKLVGDIVAHHSRITLDKPDIDVVLPAFRMLLKEVSV